MIFCENIVFPCVHDTIKYRLYVILGPLHGMNLLLDSCADDISPLTGIELFKKSVSRIYAMCGRFDGETEWNISMDILSARSFFCDVWCRSRCVRLRKASAL